MLRSCGCGRCWAEVGAPCEMCGVEVRLLAEELVVPARTRDAVPVRQWWDVGFAPRPDPPVRRRKSPVERLDGGLVSAAPWWCWSWGWVPASELRLTPTYMDE